MAQSGPGKIELFEDFTGIPYLLSETVDVHILGNGFFAGGEGYEDNDAGIATKAGGNGIVTITGANTDADTTFIGTNLSFNVGLNGTISIETRVQVPDLDTKEIFFGLTSILSIDEQLEDIVINASATAVTVVAEAAGFYFSNELTASATRWHGIHKGTNGGTAASVVLTPSTDIIVANTWQVLRMEVDTNGTARWFIDGDLKQTATSAISTSTDVAVVLAAAANTTELAIIDCDYIRVRANRDWTV